MARSVNLPPDQKVNRRKSSDRAKSHKVLLPPPLHGRPPHASSPRLTFINGYVGGDHPQVKNKKRWPSQGITFFFLSFFSAALVTSSWNIKGSSSSNFSPKATSIARQASDWDSLQGSWELRRSGRVENRRRRHCDELESSINLQCSCHSHINPFHSFHWASTAILCLGTSRVGKDGLLLLGANSKLERSESPKCLASHQWHRLGEQTVTRW